MKISIASWPVLIAALLISVGCGRVNKYSGASGAYGKFNPEEGFRKSGFIVRPVPDKGSVANDLVGFRCRSFQGVVEIPEGQGCAPLVKATCSSLEAALGGGFRDELTPKPTVDSKQALNGVLYYVKDGNVGSVHVWLIPDDSAGKVAYVIHVREDKDKR